MCDPRRYRATQITLAVSRIVVKFLNTWALQSQPQQLFIFPVTCIKFDACINFNLLGIHQFICTVPGHVSSVLDILCSIITLCWERLHLGEVLNGLQCLFYHFEFNQNFCPRHKIEPIMIATSTNQTHFVVKILYLHAVR